MSKRMKGEVKSGYLKTKARNSITSDILGTISIARSGTGFVRCEDGRAEDIMISERDLNGALHGDRVAVCMTMPPKGEKRQCGKVLRVVERSRRNIVCTLHVARGLNTAVPIMANYSHSFNIEELNGARDGDRVVVRFKSWDNLYLNPTGEILSVIGPSEEPSLDTQAIMEQYDLPESFPESVMNEAAEASALLENVEGRMDLRDKYILTIDPETAKDFDDALSYEINEDGNIVLGVHIADVSHYVKEGGALDKEARKRGTSVYLVDKVIPMLPEQLSNGVCSLMPNVDRMAFSVFITLSPRGTIKKRSFAKSVIRSKLRLSYEQAQEIIDSNGKCEIADEEGRALVLKLNELSQRLRKNRFAKFSLNISAPEIEIVVKDGRMTGVRIAPHFSAHELVEEAMVVANEVVAQELASRRIPHICRFHDAPDIEKLEDLSMSLGMLGLNAGDLSNTENLARLLKAVEGSPLKYYVSMLVLRSMKRAEYSAENEGHFGLAKKYYSHFTSPIRRYPDLVFHRQLAAYLTGGTQPSLDQLIRISKTSTECEYQAEMASRDLIEIKKYRFLQEQLEEGKPQVYDAVIVKVTDFGVFVEVQDLQISGMIHVSSLSDKFLRYDAFRESLSAPGGVSFGAGDSLKVIPVSVNFDERKVDFALIREDDSDSKVVFSSSSSSFTELEKSGKGKKRREGKSKRKGKYPDKYEEEEFYTIKKSKKRRR